MQHESCHASQHSADAGPTQTQHSADAGPTQAQHSADEGPTQAQHSADEGPTLAQREKLNDLTNYLSQFDKIGIAFSGGVDSSFLLEVAHAALGNNVVAFTARSQFFPNQEDTFAKRFCKERNIQHVTFDIDLLANEEIASNPPNRCYICKSSIMETMRSKAAELGISVIAEGSNTDDVSDYRPGFQAISEQGILSPLLTCGLSKRDIRALSRQMNLPTWNKQSMACLASRFAYGDTITERGLEMVEEAERSLTELGFSTIRVRISGNTARIEIAPDEFGAIIEEATRMRVIENVKAAGFAYVTLDLQGYRTGALNETLQTNDFDRQKR